MRAALIADGLVHNVVEYDPEADYDAGDGVAIEVLPESSRVGPGWRWSEAEGYREPPARTLTANPLAVPADGATTATVTYRNTYDDAPVAITFDANGATTEVDLTDGVAHLDVTAAQPGPVVIACDGLSVTISAEEV